MRHTQLFAYLLLLAAREWPHSESKLTLGKVEMFYHCISSDASTPITLTRQATQLASVSNTRLTVYNGTWIPLFGSLHGPIIWQPGSPSAQPHQINSCWYVADTPGPAILGFPSCERLEVVKMNCVVKVIQGTSHLPGPTPAPATPMKTAPIKSTVDLIRNFPDRFQGIGQFPGEYTIRLCDNAQPVIHAPQKYPISICPKVKTELDKMVKLGVMTPVYESTYWVSSVAYTWKVSGELHICLDPHDLNNAICRDHHCTPTVDKVAHEFVHSKYFTKLDARHGYWAVVLDSKSSLLTTFNTPYGQYHSLHLPFGLACSQDVFQKRMDQILEECEGCIGIADDITVHCCTEAEHDAHPWKLMQVTWKYGLVFNPKRTQVKVPVEKFLGCLHDESGVHPDPEKVDAVHVLPKLNQHHRVSRVPWHSNIPQPFHSRSFHPGSSAAWTAQEGCWIQLGCLLSNSFSMC